MERYPVFIIKPKKGARLRKALLILCVILPILDIGCSVASPHSELTDEQTYRLQLVQEIKAFEKELGFEETNNFRSYSDELEAYDYYFYTPKTTLPYSLDDPALQFEAGKPESAPIDLADYDVFFYSIEALAEIKTPITISLLRTPLPRFIHVIIHEDWHDQMDSTLGIEEPCGEVISYPAAMLFAEKKFGRDSAVYQALNKEFDNKLKESEVYQRYYDNLKLLYSQFHSGEISEKETLSRKARLLELMGNDLKNIWGGKQAQLNNAFIAFKMTYARHLPLMYQVYAATNFDLMKTMSIFRSVPRQGAEFDNAEELKSIETEVADFLQDVLAKTGAAPAALYNK